MSKVNLDIHPEKYQSPGNGIKGTEKDFLGKYTTYYYTNGAEKFTLTGLSYKNTRFSTVVLTPITDVKNVVTYFENGNKKLLIIYIKTTTKHFYYTNNNAISNTNSNTEFADFVTKDGRALGEDPELKEILQKIEDDKKLYYNDLSVELKDKLWRSSSVIFDLRKIPKQSYNSEVTDENITISEPTEIDNTYSRVEHGMASEPFYIKGVTLPNSESMTLDGGFPNDPLGKFYIYQKTDDYTNPLLVTLKVNVSGNVERYINSYYYLSKNSNNSDKWDISRVAGVDIGDSDIKAILDNIVDYNKLDVSGLPPTVSGKLKDLTKDLIIDLTKTIDTSVGNTKEYYSEGVHIPYIKEKTQVEQYYVVRHANAFLTFTVKSIKTGSGDITEKQLPPYGTLLGGLNWQREISIFNNIIIPETKKNKWPGYALSTTDMLNVIKHASKNGDQIKPSELGSLEGKLVEYPDVTLNVTIDFSQSDGSTYTPKDSNGTQFIVRRSKVDASEFYQFIHAAENNARFKVESVTYGENTALNNIKSAYSIDSLSAYYYGNNHTYDDLILVQFGEGNNYYQWSDSYNWIPHSGPISDFIETLGKENCKRKQGHIINLSEKGRTNNTYQCPSCSSINIAVSPSDKSELGYSLYGHTISGGNTSISGFKDERDYQTGFSSLKGYSNVKIFWYPENSGSPLLIYLPGLSTSWYKRKTKDDNEWEEVKENAPFSDNDSSKILKLLKKINGESEGPSGGAIAGYTATGVMTPLATAEAVNYTLNTGWSLIRRVMAIFNAAV